MQSIKVYDRAANFAFKVLTLDAYVFVVAFVLYDSFWIATHFWIGSTKKYHMYTYVWSKNGIKKRDKRIRWNAIQSCDVAVIFFVVVAAIDSSIAVCFSATRIRTSNKWEKEISIEYAFFFVSPFSFVFGHLFGRKNSIIEMDFRRYFPEQFPQFPVPNRLGFHFSVALDTHIKHVISAGLRIFNKRPRICPAFTMHVHVFCVIDIINF